MQAGQPSASLRRQLKRSKRTVELIPPNDNRNSMCSAVVALDHPGWVVKTSGLSEVTRNVRRGSEGHRDYRAAPFGPYILSGIRIHK